MPQSRSRRVAHPAIDPLEPRTLLSASIALDGTLQVAATDGPDAVTVRHGVNPNLINIQVGTTLYVFALDRVKQVSIDLGAGDDTVEVDTSAGLLTGVSGDLPVRIDGGSGSDSIMITGAPSGVSAGVDETFAPGPDAHSGTITGRIGSGSAQVVSYLNMESAADVSTAKSLTVVGNDGTNVVDLSAGPTLGGVTPTGSVKVYDIGTTPPPTTTPPPPTTTPPPSSGGGHTGGNDDEEEEKPTSKDKDAEKAAKEAEKAAKKAADAAKKAAKEAAKKAREQAKEEKKGDKKGAKGHKGGDKKGAKHGKRAASASPAAASATAAPSAETLLVGRAYLPLVFANKGAVTIDAGAGDDRLVLNLPGTAPAGLQTLTLDGGAGADHLAEQAPPAGATLNRANVEATSSAPDFVLG
jgi:pyruvate/2-oxoglutarate dehydrogenase complex dihydrolipoamide acyltransferase (E2) component